MQIWLLVTTVENWLYIALSLVAVVLAVWAFGDCLVRGKDQFDRLWLDGAKAPRVMAISIHPYLTGVPHRIKYLEMLYDYIKGHDGVVMWTGAEILDWYRTQVPPAR